MFINQLNTRKQYILSCFKKRNVYISECKTIQRRTSKGSLKLKFYNYTSVELSCIKITEKSISNVDRNTRVRSSS